MLHIPHSGLWSFYFAIYLKLYKEGIHMELLNHPTSLAAIAGVLILIIVLLRFRKITFNTRIITHVGLALALSTVLAIFKLYELPAGGSITLGSMVPILLIAFFYGPEIGFLTGLLYGVISLILNPFVLSPVQVLFDYPLPFMALGVAGYFKDKKILGAIVAIFVRFIFHYIAGITFWASSAPKGTSPYLYSLIYNGSFLGIDGIICVAIIAVLPLRQLYKIMVKNA
jgi:thiamine transporter